MKGFLKLFGGSALLVAGILGVVVIFLISAIESFLSGIIPLIDVELWGSVLYGILGFLVCVAGIYVLKRA